MRRGRLGRGRAAVCAMVAAALIAPGASWRLAADDGPAGKDEGAEAPADPAASPSPAPTPEKPPAAAAPITISGFVDTYYSYNFNQPEGDTQLRNFDTKHNQLSLNLIEVALEQKPTAGSRLGFRADLDFGPATDLVHAAEPGGADVFKTFQQGYVSYLAPAGRGLQLDAGKFVTPHGAEVIEAKDNWNYSRSLLFALAIPYYHVGLRAAYPFGEKLALAAFFVNGWNNAVDNNGGKTFGLQAALKPHAALSIVQNVMAGPEQADDDSTRFLSDTIVTWTVTPSLSLMANYDYGRDSQAGAPVSWSGVAAYARLQVTSGWALSPRFERVRDGDGFMTGTPQTIKELTLTSEHKIGGALLARLEYRRDFSDQPFFLRGEEKVQSQDTVTLGLVYGFTVNP
jgi:hypothetical protein